VDGKGTDDFEQTLENVLRMHLPGVEAESSVPPDIPLSDLGLDSLRAVNLVLDLEDTFAIEFPDQMLTEATFHTADALSKALRTLVKTGVAEE
jgi:acyl carrier protein